jgi:hypothetical protein
MGAMQTQLRDNNRWIDHPTVAEANEMFDLAKHSVMSAKQVRRASQVTWLSLATYKRKNDKKAEEALTSSGTPAGPNLSQAMVQCDTSDDDCDNEA